MLSLDFVEDIEDSLVADSQHSIQATLPALKQQIKPARPATAMPKSSKVAAEQHQDMQRLLHQVYKSIAGDIAKGLQRSYSHAAGLEEDPAKKAALHSTGELFGDPRKVFCSLSKVSPTFVAVACKKIG